MNETHRNSILAYIARVDTANATHAKNIIFPVKDAIALSLALSALLAEKVPNTQDSTANSTQVIADGGSFK